jgi:polysaccharide biosynthesis protein PslG
VPCPARAPLRLLAWPRPFALALALVALLAATFATSADAAKRKRKVPYGFFAAVLAPEMRPLALPPGGLDREAARMARSGVESARVTFEWRELEPSRGSFSFEQLDGVVNALARRRISVIVNVTATPQWACQQPLDPECWRSPPADPGVYAELMRRLVLRYRGRVRYWQIWNEQSAPWHWAPRPFAPSYTQLLKGAYTAIHRADRRAKVIAGSLINAGSYDQWDAVRDLYRAGARRYFDVVGVHPFTNAPSSVRRTVAQVVYVVRRVRAQMRRYHDRRKPIFVTEMTWPAARGRVPTSDPVYWISSTPRGQAQRLKATYAALARLRRKLGVKQIRWYTWATQYDANSYPSIRAFRFSGLTRLNGNGTFSPMPILRTYARLAARYEGCRKTSNAHRCRR